MKQNKIPRNEYIIKPKGKTNPYKDDVVYSNLGQWKYPGQVTKIPSNQITMQGVNYPVQGIDDTGYSQMMYPGMDYTFPGEYVTEYPMAQNGAQVEDNDSWLENIGEIVDPTGLSSWDDVYRAYKNSGLSKETALESFGALPFLGKISKVTKPGIHLTKYSGLDKILKNTLPRNKSLSRAANVSSKMGRGTDAVQAVVGSKNDSGFTWDLRHGEVPKYDGRNIFPQIDLGEHGDFAYGGSSDMYPFGGIHTKTDTHMATGGWLDNLDKAQFGKILSKPLTFLTKTEMLAKPGRNMAYRKIGNSAGLRDLIEKKGAQAPAPMKMRSGSYADTPFFGMDQRPNENYKGIFAVEVDPRNPKYDWTSRVAGTNNLGVAPVDAQTKKLLKNVPIEDLNVYKKKWFSDNYKKLDPANLEEGLKYANLQSGLENAWKWGARGAATVAAHDYMSDDESAWWPQIKNEVKSNKYIGPYLPKEEEGGWLDSYDKGGKIDMRKVKMNYFPKSNVEAQSRLDEEKAWENDYYRQQDKDYKNEVNAAVKKGIPRKQAELVIKKYKTEPQEQSTVVAHTSQGKLSKALEVVTNPVLAMKNYKGHRLPDNFSSNAEEDLFSPSSVSNLGYQFLSLPGKMAFATSSGDEAVKNVKDKDYLMAGVNAAFSAPVFSPLKNLNKLKKSGTVNKASKVLSAAPENNFTYKGVIEPFEGASKLVRDETNAYYDFLQGRQNPKLAGRWTNQNEDLMKKFPLTSKSSTGIIEKPTDPEYYKNFLVNGKSIPKNKKGGQKGLKKYTSKNVYTSVNDIMLRNEKVFGPAGKRRYKPGLNYKDGGGWLDNMY